MYSSIVVVQHSSVCMSSLPARGEAGDDQIQSGNHNVMCDGCVLFFPANKKLKSAKKNKPETKKKYSGVQEKKGNNVPIKLLSIITRHARSRASSPFRKNVTRMGGQSVRTTDGTN